MFLRLAAALNQNHAAKYKCQNWHPRVVSDAVIPSPLPDAFDPSIPQVFPIKSSNSYPPPVSRDGIQTTLHCWHLIDDNINAASCRSCSSGFHDVSSRTGGGLA